MEKKILRFFATSMTFLLVLSLTNIHALEAQSISKPLVYDELTETQQIIWNYYESIAARDWETRQALLYPPIRQNDRSYIDNPENEMNHLGLFNIKDVELVEIHSVDAEKYAYCCADEHIVENIEAYLVGFECETYEDTAFYFTGINYNIATLVEDDGDWYISNTSTAPVECIEESANMWLTGKAIQRIESRCKGSTSGYNILEEQPALRKNATSSALASLSSDLLSDMVLPSNSISSAPTVPDNSNYEPKSIVVYLPYRGSSVTDSFFEYVVRSLKIEYGSKSVNGYRDEQVQEARKAIAVAIKMFAWYAMIHPIHNEYNANVCDNSNGWVSCQGYADIYHTNYADIPAYVKDAVSWTRDYGMRSSDGRIFAANHRAGNFDAGKLSNGTLYQNGALYLTRIGFTSYTAILDYYYSYTDKSAGKIQFFRPVY